jgi:hypothetical protein
MTQVRSIKSAIITMLSNKGNALSFFELSRIAGFSGDQTIQIEDKNIYIWHDCSSEAIEAIFQLISEQLIKMMPSSAEVYTVDGFVPKFRVAKQDRHYRSPRWKPTEIAKGPAFESVLQ